MSFYGPDFPDLRWLLAVGFVVGLVAGAACIGILWWLL